MRFIPIKLLCILSIFNLSLSHLALKQLADHGISSEDNYWCQHYSDCDVLPSKVCKILANQTSAVLSYDNLNLMGKFRIDGDEKLIKCKCCVAKGTNILVLRRLWFEAIDHLNTLSSRSKDKDNPVTSMATTITQATTKPSTDPPRTSELSTDSVSIEVTSDNLLINTASENSVELTPSTDLTQSLDENG